MWARLVGNKIVRKIIGSNNFVGDLHSSTETKALLETQGVDTKNKYKVFVSTWNVGGVAPLEDLCMIMEDWLDTCNSSCDIYVLGFQEVVPLRAGNVLGSENRMNSMKWNSFIREALNGRNKGDDTKDMQNFAGSNILPEFHCVISKQMVGIFISVWVRSRLSPFVRYPSVSCVGCGIMGCLGNKGSVSVRFRLHETSFCFVCCHLASGGRQVDEWTRNANAMEILSRTCFPRGPYSLRLPRKILDHDRVIFLGDLNYRIALPEATTRLLADTKDWTALLENDQLMDGQVFGGWHEGIIKFAPTYKYYPNSDVYYGSVMGGKIGEKRRAPAWCDRIIWFGKGLKQHLYTRGESKLSDHRPVKAIFTAEVGVLPAPKGLQTLFLSSRFEQITSQLEVPFIDDQVLCQARSSFQI